MAKITKKNVVTTIHFKNQRNTDTITKILEQSFQNVKIVSQKLGHVVFTHDAEIDVNDY